MIQMGLLLITGRMMESSQVKGFICHVLLIPKKEIASLAMVDPSDHALMGHLLVKAAEVAKNEGLVENGYRVVINTGTEGGQSVDHLHLHILGGRYMGWPPG